MAIEIRAIHDDELRAWLDALSTGFHDRPDIDGIMAEVRPHWDLSRAWAAIEDGRIVGTTRTWPTELTVPGNAQIRMSAIAAVAVRPTHRRRGLLRGLLRAEHAASRERGEIASGLYASEYPIYGRFGYGPAVPTTSWTVDTAAAGFHEAAGGRSGTIDLLDIDQTALDVIRDVFEAWRRVQPGEIWRRPVMWLGDLGLAGAAWGDLWKGFVAVHRDDAGTVDGYARYHVDPKVEHGSRVAVDELHGLNHEAQVALLRFLADLDLTTILKLDRRSPAERLPWLFTNARAVAAVDASEGMWLKLHDIPRALEARTYERSGALVLEILVRDAAEDDDAARRVRVALDASPDGARAAETDRTPDLTLDGAALGAAYLGGAHLRDAVLARGWDEHRADALAEADALFATGDDPWCSTFF
jgi:predicted acetyltransferase